MRRVNPFSIAPPPRPTKAFTFKDHSRPEVEVSVVLQAMDGLDDARMGYVANALIATYLEGDEMTGVEPMPFPAIDGKVYSINPNIAQHAARLHVMQVPQEGVEPYSAEDWVAFAITAPDIFRQAILAAHGLNRAQFEQQGNAPGAEASGTSSAQPIAQE